jgi:hypothetical protein
MKLLRLGLRLGIVLFPLGLGMGCADNDSSLYIEGVLAPDAPACEFNPDPGSKKLFSGVLDLAFRTKYEGVVLVGNQLAPRGDKKQLRTETSGLQIRGSEVELSMQDQVLDRFSVNGGGFIDTSRAETPGFGLASVTMIPASRGAKLAEQLQGNPSAYRTLIATIRVYGDTLGGIEVTSGDFTFAIDVCWGCLIEYPLEAVVDPADGTGGLVCGGAAEGVTSDQCLRGQDLPIDCRTCAAESDVCYRVP